MVEPSPNDTKQDPNTEHAPVWGRVLIAGGTDWARLGRKDRVENDDAPDLASPHIVRSLSAIKVVAVHGGPSACHFVARTLDGDAYIFGRNTSGCLGVSTGGGKAKKFQKSQNKEDTPAAEDVISEHVPRRITASSLPGGNAGQTIDHAACARSHTLLVSGGSVYAAGANAVGQCGVPACPETNGWVKVNGPWASSDKVVQVAAGLTFSLILTDAGRVYATGSGEHGQLGDGRTGEYIVSAGKTAFTVRDSPVLVKGIDTKIVQIAAGNQHALALADSGVVYVWGFNGYQRLGLGHSHSHGHSQDVLVATLHPQFAAVNDASTGAKIAAGPTCSVVVDKQGMYWLAGKWKATGDGSSGQPYSNFRFLQEIMTCRMTHVVCGGVTMFGIGAEDGVIGWGQNATNCELGLGEEQPKSATKPVQVAPLAGVEVIDIAAGQNTTIFLARPTGTQYSELERHPDEVVTPEECMVCNQEDDEANPLLACDKCDEPYHPGCLEPALDSVPDGEWFCPRCEGDPQWVIGTDRPLWRPAGGSKPLSTLGQITGNKRPRNASVSQVSKGAGAKRKK